MQTIYLPGTEPTEENYPLTILLNERKDIIMLNATTKFILAASNKKWELTIKDLLGIMEGQPTIPPFNVAQQ